MKTAYSTEEVSEITPGFMVRRKILLWLPVMTAFGLLLKSPSKVIAQSKSSEVHPTGNDLVWDEFIKQCVPQAEQLYKDTSPSGQNAYLLSLAAFAARLRLSTIPRTKIYPFANLKPPVHFGVGYRGVPFFAVEWWLEPNAALPPHNHPNASVCTLGIEGEARIRNYQVVGDAPEFSSTHQFQVRETHNELMSTGRLNSLSATRDNIHTFQAGQTGARGIDFSTMHGKDIGFSFLNIDEKPRDPEARIYNATWRKLG
ncbi:MAG TPA: hypothetical protein VGN86_16635 [Pyrinomonadaceae bacterium]|nr:hypothetical protein [Pyrinomonadaceae bacterium]